MKTNLRRKMTFIFFITMSLFGLMSVKTNSFDIPNKTTTTADLISIGLDMTITSDNTSKIGTIKQRTLNFTPTFDLYNKNNIKVASAKKEAFTWGNKIRINDVNGNKIGTIEENVFDSFFSLETKYTIYDANGKTIAKSDKTKFFFTDVRIYGSNDDINITKKYFNLRTTWETNIKKSSIDKRIIMFIPAYITYSQKEKEK